MNIKILSKDSKKGFLLLVGINRPIIPNHVTKLAKSIAVIGCIRPVIVAKLKFITGKEEFYIIDGQHLFHALLRSNSDIPYIEILINNKQELIEIIALLNASSKSWAMVDYVTAWSSIHSDYIKLQKYYNIYDFDITILASILSSMLSDGGSMNLKIKRGEFKVINEKENVQILDYLTDVLKIAPRMNRFENKYLCREYISFLRHKDSYYDHKKFILKLEKNKQDLILATQEVGKLSEMFEKISK